MEEQNHPLYLIDRENLDRLLAKDLPEDSDLIDMARLFSRYEDFPGVTDLKLDMVKILKSWGITKEELNLRTRKIWSNGYRPNNSSEEIVGSSFDTSENSVN